MADGAPFPDCGRPARMELCRDVAVDAVSGCVIVSGMPGAGKTTISNLIARRVPRGAHVGGDAVNAMIRSGSVSFLGTPVDEALRQDELCNRNVCSLANNFIAFGFTVLMDTVIADRAELDFFVALLSPRPVRLLVLAPSIEVCKYRNANRAPEEQFDFDGYEQLEADMVREYSDVGWWLDTAQLSADETADLIAAELAERTSPITPGW